MRSCLFAVPEVRLQLLAEYITDFATFWDVLGITLGMENAVKAEQTQSYQAQQKCLIVLQQWTDSGKASYPMLLDALIKLKKREFAIRIQQRILEEINPSK